MLRILSIDGGGIRGILPGQVLVALEKKLQRISGRDDARIADFFDLVAGTSTGGILACTLLSPGVDPERARYAAGEAVGLYLEKGNRIFKKTAKKKLTSLFGIADEVYDEENIGEVLEETFGDVKLSQLIRPCLITSYDISRRRAHFFTSHDARNSEGYDFLVRDVARSTSAAPTYFEVNRATSLSGVHYPVIDGGVFVNNPALCAYAEARTLFSDGPGKVSAKDFFILSLGTGTVKKEYRYEKAKNWGKAEWIVPLIDIMMSGVSEVVDYQLRQIYDAVDLPQQYVRIEPVLRDASSAMDDASEKNLAALKAAGTESAERNDEVLEHTARMLAGPADPAPT